MIRAGRVILQKYFPLMKPADNLEDAVFYFDPLQSLKTDDPVFNLDSFYVDRGSDARDKMRMLLEIQDWKHRRNVKLLFTGHKGSGKSTELNKLCFELEDKFFIVPVSFQPRPDFTYVDVLLRIATSLFRRATEDEVVRKAPGTILLDLWEDLSRFLEHKIFGKLPVQPQIPVSSSLTVKVNALAIELESKFETEAESRNTIRKTNEHQLTELLDKINLLADQVRLHYLKPVLFAVEGLDRFDLEIAREVFYGHAATLTGMRASVIYLFPIGLRYSSQFSTIQQYFDDEPIILPNVKTQYRNGEPCAQGEEIRREFISSRLDLSLVADDALDEISRASGGLIRHLIALVRDAALHALGRNASLIELQDVQRAINRMRGDFVGMLEQKHYETLLARYQDKNLSSDQIIQELLESLALLEYANDDYWCDVHPIVLPEALRRTEALPLNSPLPIPAPQK